MPTEPESVVGFLAYKAETHCVTRLLVTVFSMFPQSLYTQITSKQFFVQGALGKGHPDLPG